MNARLQQFLIAENISQSQFADRIGVARASVSHIMAGRNKPGFDFIESMSRQFPTLNLDWLILGKGKMYRDSPKVLLKENVANEFIVNEPNPENPLTNTPREHEAASPSPEEVFGEQASNTVSNTSYKQPQAIKPQRSISRITIFFNDGTYQEIK